MNILVIIPARGGSEGVKDKNIMDICGRPLISYSIEDALASDLTDRTVVSTDSEQIASVVRDISDVDIIMRPSEYAKEDSPIEEALLHVVKKLEEEGYKADIVVWLQANVPIRPEGIVDKVINHLIESGADSCVTCHLADQFPEVMKVVDERGGLVPWLAGEKGIRRQEFPRRYLLDGSVVALWAENLYETEGLRRPHVYLGERVIPVMQEKKEFSLEIDTPDDADLVRYYIENAGRCFSGREQKKDV